VECKKAIPVNCCDIIIVHEIFSNDRDSIRKYEERKRLDFSSLS
jgi:hypothetical protein